jgi:hypothetical protein
MCSPLTDENSGEDGINGMVGRKKQGGLRFIHWKDAKTNENYPLNQCTWEPKAFECELNCAMISGKQATFKLGQSVLEGTIGQQHPSKPNEFYVKFKSSRRADEYVDLNLNKKVGNGGYS